MATDDGGFLLREVGDELVVMDRTTGKIHFLNGTAAEIWRRASDSQNVEQIVLALCATYDGVSEAEAKTDVDRCLQELAELGLR